MAKVESLASMRFKSMLVVYCVVASLLACGITQAASTSQSVEGAWVGATTSISTGDTTPAYGFILATGEYFFITDTANPEIIFGTSVVSTVTVLSTDMKTYDPKQGAIVNGWFTGTLHSEHAAMSIQFFSNNSGATRYGNFTLDSKYKVPSSLTIVTGIHANPHHQEVMSKHSHSYDANTLSSADFSECAAKELLVIVLAPKVSITCR